MEAAPDPSLRPNPRFFAAENAAQNDILKVLSGLRPSKQDSSDGFC